jgi:hypothetical protein
MNAEIRPGNPSNATPGEISTRPTEVKLAAKQVMGDAEAA